MALAPLLLPDINVIAAVPVLGDFTRFFSYGCNIESAFFDDQKIESFNGSHFHFKRLVVVDADQSVA